MIKELRIENFAIIDLLELHFDGSLATFTGETGAGKSILLDAIEALMGGRAESTMLRAGADRAYLEVIFAIPEVHKSSILSLLESEGLLDSKEEEVLFSREIRREGRNIARINGRTVNVGLMREIGTYLVDIHGQSEHLSLLSVRQHLHLLDRFADHDNLIQAYQSTYSQLKEIRDELAQLREADQNAARMTDLLTYQIQEIEAANITPGEEASLKEELTRLANAEKLATLAQKAYSLLEEPSPDAPSVSEMLGEASSAIVQLAKIDSSMQEQAIQMETVLSTCLDLGREMQTYIEAIEFNPKRLEQTENRLAMINTLKRKYGGDENTILVFAKQAQTDLDSITNAADRIEELVSEESHILPDLAAKASILSQSRKEAAANLSAGVERELQDLRMAGAQFGVDFKLTLDEAGLPIEDQLAAFDKRGIDRVEFLIAPNPGEGLKPLVKIASGGETSRLMLALKNVLAQADTIPTLIFDEIDQGIGGRVGAVVGEKLWRLGKDHQVFCVTHLPQLAAYGNQHFHVFKKIADGRTVTVVEQITGFRRESELALMLGGDSTANRAAAQEALESARVRKLELSTQM
jgi:DNA repair protein RecN (Recombination protein N)